MKLSSKSSKELETWNLSWIARWHDKRIFPAALTLLHLVHRKEEILMGSGELNIVWKACVAYLHALEPQAALELLLEEDEGHQVQRRVLDADSEDHCGSRRLKVSVNFSIVGLSPTLEGSLLTTRPVHLIRIAIGAGPKHEYKE
jgi:hypothetical protein